MDAYFADKAHIFLHQEASDALVTTREVFERVTAFMKARGEELKQEVRLVESSILPDECLLTMPGEHNRLNAALVLEALRAVGLTDEEIFEGLASFPGVPGRLESLGSLKGVKIYNDNNATTPQATVEGIKAVADGKNVILIAGGSYKEVNPGILIRPIEQYCKKVVFLKGTGTDKLMELIENSTIDRTIRESIFVSDSLAKTVDFALKGSKAGDVLLFSPAFASFGMFKNEYERNDQFVDVIKSYEKD
jgi:UDP-N-acetylmuramoylalanine--D-glutamate ligase